MSLNPIVSRDDLNVIGAFLVKKLKQEVEVQKHVARGTLRDSFEYRVKSTGNGISLEIWSEDYGQYVETGRKPGAKRVPITALMEWIRIKAIASDDKQVRSIAFAIQEKIFREGTPTSNSRKLAARRTGHLQFVIDNSNAEMTNVMDKRIQDNMRRQLDKVFEEASRELRSAA